MLGMKDAQPQSREPHPRPCIDGGGALMSVSYVGIFNIIMSVFAGHNQIPVNTDIHL